MGDWLRRWRWDASGVDVYVGREHLEGGRDTIMIVWVHSLSLWERERGNKSSYGDVVWAEMVSSLFISP
jgi:hypothetical protein